jgi:two-component system NtrC family sensor kinase
VSAVDPHYLLAAQAHVKDGDEESLSHAYELGRGALARGVGLLEVLGLYEAIINALVMPLNEPQRTKAAAAVSDFFREFLSPFEMIFRGYADANRELLRANEELQAANRELSSKQAQLVQAAKMASLGQLVAGVAHELNNPLAFVTSHVSTASGSLNKVHAGVEHTASPEIRQQLERARSRLHEAELGVARITELVVKLRTFSRLDEGEQKQVSIQECVDSVLTILRHRLGSRIQIDTHFGHPDIIECFPSLLNQAIMNLVSNSIDAIEDQGRISISTGADADGYAILIADTGAGIPESARERIFEPFFTTKPVGEGTGLGLSITYSIIARHRGTIVLCPRAGGGTLATVRLPLDLAHAK